MKANNPETIFAEARELNLWAENNKHTYTHLMRAHDYLLRKVSEGIYNREKAGRMMEYVAQTAAKTYAKEFFGRDTSWYEVFPPASRKECARLLLQDFERENDIA